MKSFMEIGPHVLEKSEKQTHTHTHTQTRQLYIYVPESQASNIKRSVKVTIFCVDILFQFFC